MRLFPFPSRSPESCRRLTPAPPAPARSVGDSSFPRLSTITDLILLIGTQPLLRKSAASALIDLGQAIELNATLDELQALLKGTLSQEVVVRNASLQALQVRWLPRLAVRDWASVLT